MTDPARPREGPHPALCDMDGQHVPELHGLSTAVGWPHRPEDWRMLVQVGAGLVLRGEDGDLQGCVMWFPMGAQLASLGMVIIAPSLQGRGFGRRLVEKALARTKNRGVILNATAAAQGLYASLGFTPRGTVFQHQGIVRTCPDTPGGTRPMAQGDAQAIMRLDAMARGADRSQVIREILPVSRGTVLERGGRLTGFALRRPFGRGHLIGPVVAGTQTDALSLIRPHIAALAGGFARMDTSEEAGPLRRFLCEAGLAPSDTVTTMTRGSVPEPGGAKVYGLAAQALG